MDSLLLALALLAATPEAPVAPRPPSVPTAMAPSSTPTANASGDDRLQSPSALSVATPEVERSRRAPTAKATRPVGQQPIGRKPLPRPDRGASKEPLLELATPIRPPAPEPMPTPPALSASALRDELRASSRKRQEELAALDRARAQLEKLTADIATARSALREETARLDERAKKASAEKVAARGGPGGLGQGDKQVVALAKTLKGMKPDQAAALVARLDRPLAIDLLRRMRPGDAAVVLEKVKPELAAELFSMMAGGGR